MKLTRSIRAALWLIEHVVGEPYGEAITGDLLEAVQAGRSTGWFWRQTLSALVWMPVARIRTHAVFFLFCLLWGGLYPGWWLLTTKWLLIHPAVGAVFEHAPYGTSLGMLVTVFPAASFLCTGFVVCLFHQRTHINSIPKSRLAYGVSIGLNVLFVAIAGCLASMQRPVLHLRQGVAMVFSQAHLAGMSVLLALSLFAA
ncbi:MAG TPA: hypothetical protein VIM67_07320, partial [Terriglobus sp.]